MINRRQFTAATASTLIGLRAGALLGEGARRESTEAKQGEFRFADYLGICDFPEERLSYRVSFESAPVRKQDLRLLVKGKNVALPFQLSELDERGGLLHSATVNFRADLRIGEEKVFLLASQPGIPQAVVEPITVETQGDHVVIQSNRLQILVPAAGKSAANLPVAKTPAPMLAIAREPGTWCGEGRLDGPSELVVHQVEAKLIEQGPLFVTYSVSYHFGGDRSYTTVLTVQHNESHVEIDEYSTGFGPDDHFAFRFSYKKGVDPNGRLLMANGGYSTGGSQQGASGAYNEKVNARGLLPIKLGIYTPNSINLPRAIAFWNDSGENAILFALRRLPDWKTSERAVWSASALPDNLEFYAQSDGDKFVRAAVVGAERHWAMALIPREDMVVRGVNMDQTSAVPRPPNRNWRVVSSMEGMFPYGAGPEVRLFQKLNDFSLNRYKDLVFEFPEDPRTTRFTLPHTDIESQDMTGPEYIRAYKHNFTFLAQVGWDYSGDMGANHWGWSTHPQSINYAHNFMRWRDRERRLIRSWLVFAAYLMELDTAMPQWSMLGGHPNFAVEYKQVLGIAAGLFPQHPHAKRWRDTYLSFWAEYLDHYVHKGDADTGARAGRFTESIACYNYASMEAICMAASAFKLFDGTNILDRSEFRNWAQWDMEVRLPFRVDGARIVPPQGAHAATAILSPGGRWYNVAYATAHLLREVDPALANQWLWAITNGAEGKKPDALESTLFFDYGPILRHDFGGPNEAYLHIQQLGGSGYRWSSSSNGTIYYAAKGKTWSWNHAESNGDNLDVSQLSALQVERSSLGASTASGVLYNFGFAQFYRAVADASASPYKARGVMMLRGDYIAMCDTVDPGHEGRFNWINSSNGLPFHFYRDAKHTQSIRMVRNDERFPLTLTEDQLRDFEIPAGPFAVKAAGKFIAPVAGQYRFRTNWNTPTKNVPSGDSVRLFFDGMKIFDGKGPANADLQLEARTYDISFEYVHASAEPPFVMTSWLRPDRPNYGQIENGYFLSDDATPFIHPVQGVAGDLIHIVAPTQLDVLEVTSGVIRVGRDEWVLFGNTIADHNHRLVFSGKAGYAKEGSLALFEGSHLEFKGLGLSIVDGDFGASVHRTGPRSLKGHVTGRSGGKLRLHLPSGFPTKGLKATLDGREVPLTFDGSTISFDIVIRQSDGIKQYSVFAA